MVGAASVIYRDLIQGSELWHALRARHVGGSEISALFGQQHKYQPSLFTLHQIKSGKIVEGWQDSARLRLGKALEPYIADEACRMRGWSVSRVGYATDDACPGLGASPDFIIAEPGEDETRMGFHGPGVLETKKVGYSTWKQNWNIGGEPPLAPILQLQHTIAATGFEWGAIAVLVLGGDDHPAIYPYSARPRIQATIRERVTEFWRRVRDGEEPDVDGTDSTAETLAAMYPATSREEEPLDLGDDSYAIDLCTGFVASHADQKAATERHQHWKNMMKAALRNHAKAKCTGFRMSRDARGVVKVEPLGGR
jgi:predicted phage-related endonuclease